MISRETGLDLLRRLVQNLPGRDGVPARFAGSAIRSMLLMKSAMRFARSRLRVKMLAASTVIDFYESRFNIGLTARERADLLAFLKAL